MPSLPYRIYTLQAGTQRAGIRVHQATLSSRWYSELQHSYSSCKRHISHKRINLLKEHGGCLDLAKNEQNCFYNAEALSKERPLKQPESYLLLSQAENWLSKMKVKANDVPLDLLINWDHYWYQWALGQWQTPVVGNYQNLGSCSFWYSTAIAIDLRRVKQHLRAKTSSCQNCHTFRLKGLSFEL